jgi:hypothetical protein
MKTHFLFASVAAVALAAAPIAAQSPQTPSPQSPTTQSPTTQSPSGQQRSQYGDQETTTITGCVRAGTDGRSFTLEAGDSKEQTGQTASPGQSAQPRSGMAGADQKNWSLVASSGDVDLSKYVGQRVQITGRADKSSAQQPQSGAASSASSMSRFHVQSVRVLSQTCS